MKKFYTTTGNLNNLVLHQYKYDGERAIPTGTQIPASTLGLKEYQLQNFIRNTQQGKLTVLNPSGRWSSQTPNCDILLPWWTDADYNQVPTNHHGEPQTVETVVPQWTTMEDEGIDPDEFEPLTTQTAWDSFCSTDGGFIPGTNIMAVGAPGIGKTSVLLELVSNLHHQGKKVLFISAEMNQLDMARYLKRFPNWAQVPILFLNDFDNPKSQLEVSLKMGWDLVLIDSYTEVNDLIKEETGWSKGKCEKWFLSLLNSHNMGDNERHLHTCFVTILQMNKGGQFVGSNKLKHMTTSMLHLVWDGNENTAERCMYFSKNRCGQVGIKLYFELNNMGVQWDDERYKRHQSLTETIKREKEQLREEADMFDKMFQLESTKRSGLISY